jgi:hypothetical protein
LQQICAQARRRGLIDERPCASIDSTGLPNHYVSVHFLRRGKRTKRYRPWTKLTTVVHHASYLITGASVRTGPANDSPEFAPVVRQAVGGLPLHRLYGDAGFDSEANHVLGREELGIAETVFPLNPRRGHPRRKPTTPYRREMYESFPKRRYRQRWHSEGSFSQHKRVLGECLTARSPQQREIECYYRVLTHDLMILRLCA